MLDLDREHKGFRHYQESFPNYEALSTDLIKRFRFLGRTGTYFFLYVVGESVPPHTVVMSHSPSRPAPRSRR